VLNVKARSPLTQIAEQMKKLREDWQHVGRDILDVFRREHTAEWRCHDHVRLTVSEARPT